MTILLTHDYTVSADTNIDAYTQGGFGYAYSNGSGTNLLVVAATDRVFKSGDNEDHLARLTGAGLPTGDQEVIGTIFADNNGCGSVHVRCATSGNLRNFYSIFIDTGTANESQLYRFDDGGFNLIDDADLLATPAGTHTGRLRATGSGATVTLTWQMDATAAQVYGDTASTRKTSGVPGVGGYAPAGVTTCYVDNMTVDDLVVAGGGVVPVLARQYRARWGS